MVKKTYRAILAGVVALAVFSLGVSKRETHFLDLSTGHFCQRVEWVVFGVVLAEGLEGGRLDVSTYGRPEVKIALNKKPAFLHTSTTTRRITGTLFSDTSYIVSTARDVDGAKDESLPTTKDPAANDSSERTKYAFLTAIKNENLPLYKTPRVKPQDRIKDIMDYEYAEEN